MIMGAGCGRCDNFYAYAFRRESWVENNANATFVDLISAAPQQKRKHRNNSCRPSLHFALMASSNLLAISNTSESVLLPPSIVTPNGRRSCSSTHDSFPESASGTGDWLTYDGALASLDTG
jgi:hypothetical protein